MMKYVSTFWQIMKLVESAGILSKLIKKKLMRTVKYDEVSREIVINAETSVNVITV